MLRASSAVVLGALVLASGTMGACGAPNPKPTTAAPSSSVVAPIVDASAPPSASSDGLPPKWPYRSPAVVRGSEGMVVTDESISTGVGRDVLAQGGNAADAAVATAFALAVAYPTAGNIGGGGFVVARVNGHVHALDFRETAPRATSRNTFADENGRPKNEVREGVRSAGVPGSVAGLWELHQSLGSKKKTWKELLQPAIDLAEKGFVVDDAFIDTIKAATERLKKHPVSAALFLPNGAPPEKGSTFKNPDLGRVLRRIADGGPKGFYEGPTAAAIVAQMKAEKGFITAADLGAYKAKWRKPIEFTYRGHRVTSMPPPSSGGVTLAMIGNILEGYDLKAMGFQSPEQLHYVFEAMRRAYAARNEKLGDPDFVKMPLDELLSDGWAKAQRQTILPDRATPSTEIASGTSSGNGLHTTHFSVLDAEGNAVAMTTTVNFWFGSGVTVKDAGFVLNNEMDDFAAVPGTPNGFGLVQGEANAIAPGKRMLSSMSPTIVTDADGKVELVLGAAGGPTIITAVFQELSNVVDFGLDLGRAVAAPRFHMQHLPDVVTYEVDGVDPSVMGRLSAMGYTLKERGHLADAPALARTGEGFFGAPEPRRKGSLAAGP